MSLKLILPLMGYRFLIPSVIRETTPESVVTQASSASEIYKIKHTSLVASMYEDDKGFIVLKGSQVSKATSPSISPTYVSLRKKLIDDGTLFDKGAYYEFMVDIVFGSISPAANGVSGRQSNGNVEWINSQGKTYKERQDEIYKPE